MKLAIMLIALVAAPVFADDVYLRGGGQITGEIVEQTEEFVTVDVGGGGTITARMESVVRIERGTSPLQEYRERATSIPDGDAEAWRELARWATNRALSSQALKAWTQVVSILPYDPEANSALGRVQLNGRWVNEEESYRAQGYIEFEGQWMTPAERQAILANRQDREAADRRANEARIKEIDAEIQEEKQRKEDARREHWNRNPVPWGWGYGPTIWPPNTGPGWDQQGRQP